MKDVLFRSDEAFWFTHAIVSIGYHGSGIAPEEALSEENSGFTAMKLSVRLDAACTGGPNVRTTAPHAVFKRITGRGRYIEAEKVFEVDCVCSVEKTSYTEAKSGFWQFQ